MQRQQQQLPQQLIEFPRDECGTVGHVGGNVWQCVAKCGNVWQFQSADGSVGSIITEPRFVTVVVVVC